MWSLAGKSLWAGTLTKLAIVHANSLASASVDRFGALAALAALGALWVEVLSSSSPTSWKAASSRWWIAWAVCRWRGMWMRSLRRAVFGRGQYSLAIASSLQILPLCTEAKWVGPNSLAESGESAHSNHKQWPFLALCPLSTVATLRAVHKATSLGRFVE